MSNDFEHLLDEVEALDPIRAVGRVQSIVGLSVRASMPDVRLGERVQIDRKGSTPLDAEVIGFDANDALLLPIGATDGIGPGDIVKSTGRPFELRCSEAMLGRVVDGLGQPLDSGPKIDGEMWAIDRPPPPALSRPRIDKAMSLGIRPIDACLTVGHGQRIGLFAGSGVGKSTLLGQIARQANADVFVACLIGERGREVREFLDDSLGVEGQKRGVVVCATADTPALVRLKSALTATAIAEWFRDQGRSVVLLMDSVTRFARAAREVGLAAGEPPARRGYPPSVFARLPQLLERGGNSDRGSITAFYTVLVEGSDMEEPIADEVRGILDGHIVLSRELASRGRWPAIDITHSLSRVMPAVTTEAHRNAANKLREDLALLEEKRDLVMLGAYQRGSDAKLDAALAKSNAYEAFVKQRPDEEQSIDKTIEQLSALVR
ncbi:MAG: FliI/YscN family ATPase [Polyangiales bacterium]